MFHERRFLKVSDGRVSARPSDSWQTLFCITKRRAWHTHSETRPRSPPPGSPNSTSWQCRMMNASSTSLNTSITFMLWTRPQNPCLRTTKIVLQCFPLTIKWVGCFCYEHASASRQKKDDLDVLKGEDSCTIITSVSMSLTILVKRMHWTALHLSLHVKCCDIGWAIVYWEPLRRFPTARHK